ncbi:MAG: hypothetical protein ABL914_12920, partial [Novosphingobium sp.]|uniref:hypothetical protein n=1 Tax=Novosphingobium sp. TaxID=1874826 RepID=UPI0032BEF2E0
MIASPVLSLTTATPVPAGTLASELSDGSNGANFLALLAQSLDQAGALGLVGADPAAVTSGPPLIPAAAIQAATPGKMLPPALPVAAVTVAFVAQGDNPVPAGPGAAPIGQPDTPAKAAAGLALQPIRPNQSAHGLPKKAKADESGLPESSDPAAPESIEAAIAVAGDAAITTPSLPVLPARAEPAEPAALSAMPAMPGQPESGVQTPHEHHPEQPGKSQDAPGQLVRLQPPGLQDRPVGERQPVPSLTATAVRPTDVATPAAAAQAVQPQGAAPPLAQLRIDVALAEPLRSIAPAPVRTPALAAALLGE